MGKRLGHNHPHMWKSGPDPVDHKLFNACQRARAQAWFRGEDWEITEQEYIDLWRTDDRYLKKGRHNSDLCMTRRDPFGAWTIDNVQIISRLEHYKTCNGFKALKNKRRKNEYVRQPV